MLSRTIVHGIANKLKNYEEFPLQKLKELDNQGVMNFQLRRKRILLQ